MARRYLGDDTPGGDRFRVNTEAGSSFEVGGLGQRIGQGLYLVHEHLG